MMVKSKICSIVGARPQFIKAAPVSCQLRKVFQEVIIHTGQHYDTQLSRIFFKELDIPVPNYNLEVGSGFHGWQTGRILKGIEKILIEEDPALVLVYGDTNSTLAGALASAKLNIPVVHIEAGLRSKRRGMPEEINRVLTDHVSSFLFCPTKTAVDSLNQEGIREGVFMVGDVMKDAFDLFLPLARNLKFEQIKGLLPGYYLLTIHRAENTANPEILKSVFDSLGVLSRQVVFPIHPRTRKLIIKAGLKIPENLIVVNPVSYLEMLNLETNADLILTDSGGVQKEAYMMKVPCLTIREETEWIGTLKGGWNTLVGSNPGQILDVIKSRPLLDEYNPLLFGDGSATAKIVSILGKITMGG